MTRRICRSGAAATQGSAAAPHCPGQCGQASAGNHLSSRPTRACLSCCRDIGRREGGTQLGARTPGQTTRACSAAATGQRIILATRASRLRDSCLTEAASPEEGPAGHTFFYLAFRRFSFRPLPERFWHATHPTGNPARAQVRRSRLRHRNRPLHPAVLRGGDVASRPHQSTPVLGSFSTLRSL